MAVRFDSTDQLTRTASLPSITGFTLMAWIYPVALSGFGGMLSFGLNDPSFYGVLHNGTTYTVYYGSNIVGGSTLSTATWYHIALTCAGTGTNGLLAYLNGVVDITTTGFTVTTGQLEVGRNFGGDQFNGRIANVLVYDAVLTADDIKNQMRRYMPIRTANLNTWSPLLNVADAAINYAQSAANWTVSGTLTTEDGPPIPWSLYNRIWSMSASGGTVYTATLAGAFTPSGSLVKVVNKVLQGSTTPVGSVSKRVGKVLSGAVALSGGVRKTVNKVLSGSVTPAGVVSVALRRAVSLAGSVSPVGVVVKRVDKVFSGAVVPVGSITKRVDKIFSGSLTLSGQLVKQVNKILTGIINPIGTITSNVISGGGQLYTATLSGAVGLSGALTKQVNKVFGGTVTPVGTVSKVVGRVLQGSVGVSGVVVKRVSKVFSGVVTPIGSVSKVVSKSFAGIVTPVGVLTKSYIRSIVLSGVVTPVGALVSSVIAGSGVVLRTMYPLFRRKRR